MLSSRTVIAQTLSEMDAIAPLWEHLLCRQPHSMFQRFSWNRLAAQIFSDRLAPYVVCVESVTGAAIVPAAINSSGDRFELLGEVLFDYRDVLHSGDPEVLRLAWQRVAQHQKPLHVLSVDHLAGRERWSDFPLSSFAMAPQMKDMAEDTFRLAHSRLGRQMRRLQKQGVLLRISSGSDSRVVRHLYECRRTHFAADENANVFRDSRRCEFMVAAAAHAREALARYTLWRKMLL